MLILQHQHPHHHEVSHLQLHYCGTNNKIKTPPSFQTGPKCTIQNWSIGSTCHQLTNCTSVFKHGKHFSEVNSNLSTLVITVKVFTYQRHLEARIALQHFSSLICNCLSPMQVLYCQQLNRYTYICPAVISFLINKAQAAFSSK